MRIKSICVIMERTGSDDITETPEVKEIWYNSVDSGWQVTNGAGCPSTMWPRDIKLIAALEQLRKDY